MFVLLTTKWLRDLKIFALYSPKQNFQFKNPHSVGESKKCPNHQETSENTMRWKQERLKCRLYDNRNKYF